MGDRLPREGIADQIGQSISGETAPADRWQTGGLKMVISMHNTVLTDIQFSHSLQCPLGGGFWVYAPDVGHVTNCTEDGRPVCTCTPRAHLQFEDGTQIVVSVGSFSTI
jgi:hypothetical protein